MRTSFIHMSFSPDGSLSLRMNTITSRGQLKTIRLEKDLVRYQARSSQKRIIPNLTVPSFVFTGDQKAQPTVLQNVAHYLPRHLPSPRLKKMTMTRMTYS